MFKSDAQALPYKKLANGVEFKVHSSLTGSTLVRLEVISEKIIHVLASADKITEGKSLMLSGNAMLPVKWSVLQKGSDLILQTSALTVKASLQTGAVSYRDKTGKLLTSELAQGRTLSPVSYSGESSWQTGQTFSSYTEEAYYGLGQHQDGLLNYKDQHVDLLQNNTEVAIPLVVSSKNYGILWDNYSITKVSDTRDYQPLSAFKLYSADGNTGWLTATYSSSKSSDVVQHAESEINYVFLDDRERFPAEYKLPGAAITWTGEIESPYTGIHNLQTKYSGYIKLWIDGKLLLNKWRQNWNPGTEVSRLALQKETRYKIRIEWIPEGGYLAVNWLGPVPDQKKNQFAFLSESGDQVDYYFISGKNADEVISGYRTLTGKATMLPKWAMGFWQSRERYKTQDELLDAVKGFRDRKIPLDNIVLDWSYWKQDQWGSQEFDESRFADPQGMIKKLHDTYNTRLMISVWAKFYEGIDTYANFDKNGWLYKRNIANRERDWIGKGYVSTFYDAMNPFARDAFWNLLNDKLYSKGVDAWWMDASEPDIHSNLNITKRKAIMDPTYLGSSSKYFNAFPLQNAKGIYEGQRKTNPHSRVFILTRSGYAGMQRYASATWSGDIASRWEDLKAQIPAGINFSLSGMPYWTMDIGGFAVEKRYENAKGKDLDEWRELNTRWYQFGAFVPLFRSHGQFPFREIFNIAPENHPAYTSMLYYNKLRYRLMPYIYSIAGKVYQDNYTMMRGLIMDFPNDPAVKNIADQYLFGPALLVNPVYEFGAGSRDVYLPAGSNWYDLYSGKPYKGGQTLTAAAPYERMPVFVKEGSILPCGPDIQYTSEKPADPLTLYVYGGKDASFTLYEDDATTYGYEKGEFSQIPLTYTESTKTLRIGSRKGSFNGMLMNRTIQIVLINAANPKAINLDLSAPDHSFNYNGSALVIKLAK